VYEFADSGLSPSENAFRGGVTFLPALPAIGASMPLAGVATQGAALVSVNASDGTGYGRDAAVLVSMCNDAPLLNFSYALSSSDLVAEV